MTQEAVVTKVYSNGTAEVAVTRMTACGGECGACEACIFQNELKTIAKNLVDAKVGEGVIIESKTSTVFKAVLLVYVMPLILFILGYAAAAAAGASEGLRIISSFVGLIIGGFAIIWSQKLKNSKNKFTYDIIGKVE